MATQVQITSIGKFGGSLRVLFNLVLSGIYTTGQNGDIVDFTKAIKDPTFSGIAETISSDQGPQSLDIWDAGGNIANGLFPILGTSASNCRVKIVTAFNTELGTGAYSAALLADKICGEVVFPFGV